MLFVLTTAGEALIASTPGIPPVFDEFRLGDSFGYTPSSADTGLHGSAVWQGVPSNPITQSNSLIKYTILLDPNLGDFQFGEVALKAGGVTVALGAASVLISKMATLGSVEGNLIVIDCYVTTLGTNYAIYAELGNTARAGILPVLPSIEFLPPAATSYSNTFIVSSPDTQNSVLAFASAGQWGITGYEELLQTSSVDSATSISVDLADSSVSPLFNGEIILQFLDGPASGLMRIADSYDPTTKSFGFSAPLPSIPLPGNQVQVLRKSVLQPSIAALLASLSPALTASHLNALVANPVTSTFVRMDGASTMAAPLNLGGFAVQNVALPVLGTDAANRDYVDTIVASIPNDHLQLGVVAPSAVTPVTPPFYLDTVAGLLYAYTGSTWLKANSPVLSQKLDGLSTASAATIIPSDTVLSGFGKLQKQSTDVSASVDSHLARVDNPHLVTSTQLGLGNVDNTSDVNKPLSTAAITALALKEPVLAAGLATQYYRGDKVWAPLEKHAVGLWNVDNTSDVNKPVSTAQATAIALKEPVLTAGTTAQYYRGDKSWQDTSSAVRSTVLAGLNVAAVTPITVTDTVLSAIGKLQGQIDSADTAIATKEPSITAGTTAQYYRGDKSWQDFEGDVRGTDLSGFAVSTGDVVSTDTVLSAIGKLQGQLDSADTATTTALAGKESSIAAGATTQYWRGDKSWQDLESGVRSTVLTGLSLSSSDVTPADTVLSAIGKLQGQIDSADSSTLTKEPLISAGTTSQYYRGDKSWQTLDKATVGLSNTDNTSDANKPVSTATATALAGKESSITAGTTAQYYRGDKSWQDFEGDVRGTDLSGFVVSTGDVVSTDTVLSAFGKVQGQIDSADTAIATKEPSITAGTTAQYYRGDKSWQTLDKASVGLPNVDNTTDLNKPISTLTATALAGKESSVSAGTTAQYYRGDKSWQTLDKTAVGLGNVDNTSDANKPVSTAAATAIALKENTIGAGALTQYWRGDKSWQTLDKTSVGLANADNTSDANKPVSALTSAALALKENTANKNVASGYAGLDATGKVPAALLPSYTDDVLEYANTAAFPAVGTGGLLYVALDTGFVWRWSGTAYVNIQSSPGSTDFIVEGATNLYFTQQRVRDSLLTGLSTASVAVATATDSVLTSIGKLQGQASAATTALALKESSVSAGTTAQYYRGDKSWQTLDKSSVGLGNVDNTSDANKPISTLTATALAGKESSITAGTTAQYYRGDKSWQTLDKTAVGLGNVDNTTDLNKPISTLTATALAGKESSITAGTTAQYYRGDKSWQDLGSEVRSTTLTGLSTATVSAITSADTVLIALGKLQAQAGSSGSGSVTSVGGTGTVSGLTLTGTVTTTGSLTLGGTLAVTPTNFASQAAATVLAAPNAASGVPSFRALVAADIPTLNQNTTGNAGTVTNGLYSTGSYSNPSWLTSLDYSKLSGTTPTWNQNTTGTASNVTGTVAIANGGTGSTTASGARTNLGATTVGTNLFTLTDPSAVRFLRVNADNTVSALDAPTFLAAIGAGSGGTGTVTSVGGAGTVNGLTLTGTVTTSGSLTLGGTLSVTPSNFASQSANLVLAAPDGSAGVPTFRSIVAADIPTLNQNTTGTASNVTGTVAIVNGGTGATTAAAAKTNLGLGNVDNTSDANKPVSTATATALAGKESSITAGTTAQYYRGDKSWQTLDKSSVGLGNVDNTSDANKPVSPATATALAGKESSITAGTTAQYWRGDKSWQTLDKSSVGLGNVDNTSDANKPVSTATATALAGKESSITAGTTAQYWRGDKSWQTLDKSSVGLGNVDNTTDLNKPISTATQTALDTKLPGIASSVDNTVPRFDGTTGKVIQGSGVIIDDANQVGIGKVPSANLDYRHTIVNVNSNTTASVSKIHVFRGSYSLSLPASASDGDWIGFKNRSGLLTASITRNGAATIEGGATDLVVDKLNLPFFLVYTATTDDWTIL